MPRVPIPIGRKTDQAQSPLEGIERLLNGYFEQVPDGKQPTPIYGTPGQKSFKQLSSGAVRGMHVLAENLYVVCGTTLYRISSDTNATVLGTVDAGDIVSMADDGFYLSIVVPETGHIFYYDAISGAFTSITDPDVPAATSVCWIDGYFVYSQADSDIFFISDLGSPLTFNALNYAEAEWRPGALKRVLILDRTVLMMKNHSIEGWYDTGDTSTFVFSPRPDIHVPVGLAGTFAVTSSNQAVYFLADDLTVRRLDGLVPTRISTYAVERLIGGARELGIPGWSDPSRTLITAHVWRGHLFIVLHNPDGCVVFDQATGLWHERQSTSRSTWAGGHYAYVYGQHLMGDRSNPIVSQLASDLNTDFGHPISFEVTFPFIYQGGQPIILHTVELAIDTGRTKASAAKASQVQMTQSRDGYTFEPWRTRSLGAQGQYGMPVRFNGFGRSRGTTLKVRITDDTFRALLGAQGDVEVLTP